MNTIYNEKELDLLLTEPSEQLVEAVRSLSGDIAILGANGKMGLSQSIMAKRAIDKAGMKKQVYAVSRFSDREGRDKLDAYGIKTIACDLSDLEQVRQLPVTENMIFMAGRKFGTTGAEYLTWVMNVLVPANCARYYKGSRIVAYSTGNVYPGVKYETGGTKETDMTCPVGEYAQSCLGRERVFEYFAIADNTPVLLNRLNYATDLRYGVLYDIGSKIWNDEPVVTGVDYFNIIWQGDAVNYALLALQKVSSPATILNISGSILSAKEVVEEMGVIMKKTVRFKSTCQGLSLITDVSKLLNWFGAPSVSSKELIRMQAEWIMQGGKSLNKPTHFEVDDGKF